MATKNFNESPLSEIANPEKMILVCCYSPKGGVGKTMTATQLAVAAVMNKFKVALYDLDPQQSANNYLEGIEEKFRPVLMGSDLNAAPPADTRMIVIDCAPNVDFIPPKAFTLVSPTGSSKLDLGPYRRVLDLENQGYNVIKVINNFNPMRVDDKNLLAAWKTVAIISANSAIRGAMNNGKTIWNSNLPNGTKAKHQFNYLIKCILAGKAPEITLEKVKKIANGEKYEQ